MMDLLSSVNQWIAAARERISKAINVPLIDDINLEMSGELWDAWMLGDDRLREAIDNVLSRDLGDLAARFVALNVYYQLATLKVVEDEDEVASNQEKFRSHLAYLVRLRDIEQCTTLREVRWEITNSVAIADHSRAVTLMQQLKSALPSHDYHYLQGRLHFLLALAPTSAEEEGLERWDLPIGPAPQGFRSVWARINAFSLYAAGVNQRNTRANIEGDAQDHLHDAIKHLDKVLLFSPPSGRFMIARSYSEVGDHHNARRQYQWLLDHYSEVSKRCAEEAAPFWCAETAAGILTKLYEAIVSAYEKGGETVAAIGAVQRWITAFPDQLGTFERLARLHQQSGDYRAAYEWLRKEADRNPALSEDPNVSIALALGSVGTPAAIEDVILGIGNSHKEECQRIGALLLEYWPIYARLAQESQERWSTGVWLRTLNLPHAAGLAAHSFAWVVERELRTTIIDRFRGAVAPGLVKTNTAEEIALVRYLQGYGGITLGQIFTTIERTKQSRSPLLDAFREWLKREHPWLAAGLQRMRTDKIVALRNREDHADLQTISAVDATTMRQTCYDVLNLLHRG